MLNQKVLMNEIEKSLQKALYKKKVTETHHLETESEDCGCDDNDTAIVKGQLLSILMSAKKIFDAVAHSTEPVEDWILSKISLAEENLKSACIHIQEHGNISVTSNVVWEKGMYESKIQNDGNYSEALDADKDDDALFEKETKVPDKLSMGVKPPTKNIKMEEKKR